MEVNISNVGQNLYSSFKPASCFPDCWCEMPRYGQLILEPGNFWSNLAFIFCAGILWFYFKHIPHRRLTSICFAAIGIGSMAFHGTQTFIGQTLDVFCMYMLVSLFIFQLWRVHFKYKYYFLLNSVLLLTLYFAPELRRFIFFFLVLVLVGVSIKKLRFNKYLMGSIGSMVVAQIIWNLDRLKIVCSPQNFITGHFFWHILSALSAFLFVCSLNKSKYWKLDISSK